MRVWTVLAGGGLLACLLFSAGLGPLLEPLLYTMTPLQRFYAGDYLVSSWRAGDPAATTETRLLWKTRPVPAPVLKSKKNVSKTERDFALERDVEPRPLGDRIGKYEAEPFILSDGARAEGWTAVGRGDRHRVTLAALHVFLEEDVYGGHPLWRFFIQPAVGLAVLLTLALALRAWRERLRRQYPWRTGREALWIMARDWSAASAGRLAEGMRWPARSLELEGGKSEARRELPAPAPRPEPLAVASGAAPPEPSAARQSVSVPPRRAYVWNETEGID